MAECEDEAMLAEVVDGIVAAVRAAVGGAAHCGTGGGVWDIKGLRGRVKGVLGVGGMRA
jgi:hypothetical protein